MTPSEIRVKVAESKNKGWFQSLTFNLEYDYLSYSISLTGISSIYDFAYSQCSRYQEFSNLPDELNESKRKWEDFKLSIIQIINLDDENNYKWEKAVDDLKRNQYKLFPSDAPETDFLIRTFSSNSEYYDACYNFIVGRNLEIDKDNFIGYQLAYDFVFSNKHSQVDRISNQYKNLEIKIKEYEEQLSTAKNQLINYLADGNTKVQEAGDRIDTLINKKEGDYNSWFDSKSNIYTNFYNDSTKKINELETLYSEKLKLEAPAKYWNDRAAKLRKEGKNWLYALIFCIIISILILIWILNLIAKGTMAEIFNEISTAIKWSVTLITLISFLAYAIKVLSKLTFSAFHLVRDAEEREQLTYVYLALQKESKIDVTERHLVMQSLFSRADSGLLKDDSQPTMPGNIVDQIIKR